MSQLTRAAVGFAAIGVLCAAGVALAQPGALEPGVLSEADILEPGVLGPEDVLEPGVLGDGDPLWSRVGVHVVQPPYWPPDVLEPGVLGPEDVLEPGVLGPDDEPRIVPTTGWRRPSMRW